MALAFLHAATQAPQPMHAAASIAASADGQRVGVLRRTGAHGDETTGLLNAIKGTTIDDEVFDDGEGLRAEGLDPDGVTGAELAHVKLAGRGGLLGAVWHAVDLHGAHAADAFAAVVIECDGFLAFGNEALVHDVHHFEKGGMIRDVRSIDVLEMTGLACVLTPDFEVKIELGHER
jgi:hypothetical protein